MQGWLHSGAVLDLRHTGVTVKKKKKKSGLSRDLTYSSLDLTEAQLSLNHTNDRSPSQSEIRWGWALAKQIDPESSRCTCCWIWIFHTGTMQYGKPISIQKILWIDSGKQWPSTTRCPLLDASRSLPPAARSALPASALPSSWKRLTRSRVGGWCAAETPSELWRRVAHVWRTALLEIVNSQRSQSHPGCCTVRPRVALSSRKRGGFNVNVLPPCI